MVIKSVGCDHAYTYMREGYTPPSLKLRSYPFWYEISPLFGSLRVVSVPRHCRWVTVPVAATNGSVGLNWHDIYIYTWYVSEMDTIHTTWTHPPEDKKYILLVVVFTPSPQKMIKRGTLFFADRDVHMSI